MEKPKERLTGLDADGYIISTEEATIIAARPVLGKAYIVVCLILLVAVFL